MKKVKIERSHEELISSTIAKLVYHYSKNEKIEAIYMNAFHEEKVRNYNPNLKLKDQIIIEPNIHLVLIYNDLLAPKDIYDLYEEIKNVREITGISLNLVDKPAWNYNPHNMDTREFLACRDLVNGNILFDRNDYFTNLKQNLEKNNINSSQRSFITLSDPYLDAIEFDPPLQLKK